MTDFLDIADEAARAVAPSVKRDLQHQASQSILQAKGRTFFPAPISATGIAERIRDLRWWKPSVIRDGESYASFKRRADAQRSKLGGESL